MKQRLSSSSGMARIIFILLAVTAAAYGCFAIGGYIHHLNQAKLLFDEEEVDEAVAAAKHQYVLDGESAGITYYYDADGKKLTDASAWTGKIDIEGYGRSDAAHNRKSETGAAGIPNKGSGNGGAQFLAIAINPAGNYAEAGGNVFSNTDGLMISARWQGKYLTWYDYTLMTNAERSRLTAAQSGQINRDHEKQKKAESQP